MFKKIFILSNILLLFAACSWVGQSIPFDYLGFWLMACVLVGYVGRKIISDSANHLFPRILEEGQTRIIPQVLSIVMLVFGITGFVIKFVPSFGLCLLFYIWTLHLRRREEFREIFRESFTEDDELKICDDPPIHKSDTIQDLKRGETLIYKEKSYRFLEYSDYGFGCVLEGEGGKIIRAWGNRVKRPEKFQPTNQLSSINKQIIIEFAKRIQNENVLRCVYEVLFLDTIQIGEVHFYIEMNDDDDDLITNIEEIVDSINEKFSHIRRPAYIEYFNKSYNMDIFDKHPSVPLNPTDILKMELPKDLGMWGFPDIDSKYEKSAEIVLDNQKKIQEYIVRYFNMDSKINKNRSSYGLKHIVEKGIGEYVSNGQLIAAMILLGYNFEKNGVNAYFNVTEESILIAVEHLPQKNNL